jgi:hypothetical protein
MQRETISASLAHQRTCQLCKRREWCEVLMDMGAREAGYLSFEHELAATEKEREWTMGAPPDGVRLRQRAVRRKPVPPICLPVQQVLL